jgi:hypothetical protein
MLVHCRHEQLHFVAGGLPEVNVKNFEVTLDDEFGSELCRAFPNIFAMKKFTRTEQIKMPVPPPDEAPSEESETEDGGSE